MADRSDTATRSAIRFRPLEDADLPAAQAMIAALRWPHRLEDLASALSLGEGLAAEAEGRLVGTALGWKYGPHAGTLGMVVVAADMQGRGIGRALTEGVLGILGDRGVLLTATEVGLPLYRTLGFVAVDTIRQHQSADFCAEAPQLPPGQRLRPLGAGDARLVTALDARAAGWWREALFDTLLPASEGLVLEAAGVPAGFALIRRFGRGQVIGPVVAPDAAGARALIAHGLGARAGQFVRIDVSDGSGLSPWLRSLGLPEVDSGVAMLRGPMPRGDGTLAGFAMASQSLG